MSSKLELELKMLRPGANITAALFKGYALTEETNATITYA